jgi:hypothetical protein
MITKPLTRRLAATCLLSVGGVGAVYAQSASEERPLAHFSRLVVSDGIDIYLTQSTEESLRLEVEGLELADIVSEVSGETLTLRNSRGRGWFDGDEREATVYLNFVQLSSIEASGGSDIESRNDLNLETLKIDASGGSDIDIAVSTEGLALTVSGGSDAEVRGETEAFTIAASGGSDISAEAFQAEQVTATVAGGSDAIIRVSDAIVLEADGGSDVIIYGNPARRTVNNDRSSDVIWH